MPPRDVDTDHIDSRLAQGENDGGAPDPLCLADAFGDDIALDEQFLEYASRVDGIRPAPGEWEETEPYMMPQLKALVGRFSKLDNEAFYRFYLPIDDIIQAALKN